MNKFNQNSEALVTKYNKENKDLKESFLSRLGNSALDFAKRNTVLGDISKAYDAGKSVQNTLKTVPQFINNVQREIPDLRNTKTQTLVEIEDFQEQISAYRHAINSAIENNNTKRVTKYKNALNTLKSNLFQKQHVVNSINKEAQQFAANAEEYIQQLSSSQKMPAMSHNKDITAQLQNLQALKQSLQQLIQHQL